MTHSQPQGRLVVPPAGTGGASQPPQQHGAAGSGPPVSALHQRRAKSWKRAF